MVSWLVLIIFVSLVLFVITLRARMKAEPPRKIKCYYCRHKFDPNFYPTYRDQEICPRCYTSLRDRYAYYKKLKEK